MAETVEKSPTEQVIEKLGGVDQVSVILGLTYQAVWNWKVREGGIPSKYWQKLINEASSKGVALGAEDFMSKGSA